MYMVLKCYQKKNVISIPLEKKNKHAPSTTPSLKQMHIENCIIGCAAWEFLQKAKKLFPKSAGKAVFCLTNAQIAGKILSYVEILCWAVFISKFHVVGVSENAGDVKSGSQSITSFKHTISIIWASIEMYLSISEPQSRFEYAYKKNV